MNLSRSAVLLAALGLASCRAPGVDPFGPDASGLRRMESALAATGSSDPLSWDRLGGSASELDDGVARRSFDRAEELLWPDSRPKNGIKMGLPFEGRWVVTQGNRGDYSHRRLADRFAWDFQKVGDDGEPNFDGREDPKGFWGFGAHIIATADGVVVKAEDGVPDNLDGIRNYGRAGGNVVVIRHASGEMSHYCHMQKGSVAVKVGDVVKRGQRIGKCGCSGNAIEPHLHFVLRAGPTPLDYSIPSCFDDAAIQTRRGAGKVGGVPDEGDFVENGGSR
jgi:hypothetical protein